LAKKKAEKSDKSALCKKRRGKGERGQTILVGTYTVIIISVVVYPQRVS
jgi:hypothetical protein